MISVTLQPQCRMLQSFEALASAAKEEKRMVEAASGTAPLLSRMAVVHSRQITSSLFKDIDKLLTTSDPWSVLPPSGCIQRYSSLAFAMLSRAKGPWPGRLHGEV